jgi:hypothetical protein
VADKNFKVKNGIDAGNDSSIGGDLTVTGNIVSPTLTGTPTAPTAIAGTNTTQIATTAFVSVAVSDLVDSAPTTLDTLNELAAALGDDPNFATTVTNSLAAKAPLASPALTGTPTAPTAAAGTSTTQLATTAFVQQELTGGGFGDVSKVGTPVDNQIGVWTGNGTIEGDANFTWNGSTLSVAGQVGIGTTSPSRTLDVDGSIGVHAPGTTTEYVLLNADANNSYFSLIDSGGTSVYFDTTSADNYILNGNVGIGNSTPNALLTVGEASTQAFNFDPTIATGGYQITHSMTNDGYVINTNSTARDFIWQGNGTELVRFDSLGATVTLGNFSFDVDQTVGAGQDNFVLTYNNATGLISLEAATGGGGGGGDLLAANNLSDVADAATARSNLGAYGSGDNVSFGTLTASGDVNIDGGTFFVDVSTDRVGINTTSPDYRLQVNGSVATVDSPFYVTSTTDSAVGLLRVVDSGGNNAGQLAVSGLDGAGANASWNFQNTIGVINFQNSGDINMTGGGNLNVDSGTLFVDVSTNRVGIGTGSPSGTVHISETGKAGTGSPALYIGTMNAGTESDISLHGNAVIGGETSVSHTFESGGSIRFGQAAASETGTAGFTEVMRIDGSGVDVGAYRMNFAGGTSYFVDTNANFWLRDGRVDRGDGTGAMYFSTGSNRYLYYNGTNYYLNGAELYAGVDNAKVMNSANIITDRSSLAAIVGVNNSGTDSAPNTDLNDIVKSGFWQATGNGTHNGPTSSSWTWVMHHEHTGLNGYGFQLGNPISSNRLYIRHQNANTWASWSQLWNSGEPIYGDGTVSLPYYSFDSDTDSGMFLASAGQVGIAIGGVGDFRFASSYLSIADSGVHSSSSGLLLQESGGTAYIRNRNSGSLYLGTNEYNFIQIRENGTTWETIMSAQAGEDVALYFGDATDPIRAGFFFDTSANILQFQGYNNTTVMRMGGDYLQLGANADEHNLNIHSAAGKGIVFYNAGTQMGDITAQDTTWFRINQNTAKNIYTPRYIRADGGFFVDATDSGINADGHFLLPDNHEIRFGSGNDSHIFHTGSHTYWDLVTGNLYIRDTTTNRFLLDDNGSFTATGNITAYGTISDINAKENVSVITGALNKVKTLDGITYNYKNNPDRMTGVIAQQVRKVLPEAVYDIDPGQEELVPDGAKLAVRHANMVGLLIEAIKELSDKVEALENGLTK